MKKNLAVGYFPSNSFHVEFMQSNKSCIFSIKSKLKLRTLENFVELGCSYKKLVSGFNALKA